MINPCKRLFLSVLTIICIALFAFHPLAIAAEPEKIKAADLVTDGQTIDLQHEKYITLFKELREKHLFTQVELDRMFKGIKIDRKSAGTHG